MNCETILDMENGHIKVNLQYHDFYENKCKKCGIIIKPSFLKHLHDQAWCYVDIQKREVIINEKYHD